MATIKGTWILNDIQLAIESESARAQTVSFTSNGIQFDIMLLLGDYTSALTYSNQSDSYSVYTSSSGWINSNYRMVDFGETEQEVSAEWYEGFTKNAVQFADELLLIWKSTLSGIADAVRSKTGKTEQMLGSEIEDEIRSFEVVEEWDGTYEVFGYFGVSATDKYSRACPAVGQIISFRDGMTWKEWVNSEYNTFGFVIDEENFGDRVIWWNTDEGVLCGFPASVSIENVIVSAETYRLRALD